MLGVFGFVPLVKELAQSPHQPLHRRLYLALGFAFRSDSLERSFRGRHLEIRSSKRAEAKLIHAFVAYPAPELTAESSCLAAAMVKSTVLEVWVLVLVQNSKFGLGPGRRWEVHEVVSQVARLASKAVSLVAAVGTVALFAEPPHFGLAGLSKSTYQRFPKLHIEPRYLLVLLQIAR